MPSSKVCKELGEAAGVLLIPCVVKEMIQTGVTLDKFEQGGGDLQDFVVATDFLLHGKLARVLYFFLDLKFLGLILNHNHVSKLLKHVNHFSQAVNFKFTHFFNGRDAM